MKTRMEQQLGTRRRVRGITRALVALILLGGSTTVWAQGPGGGGRPGGRLGGVQELDLSDTQLGQVQDVRERTRAEVEPLVTELRDRRDALQEAVTADAVNESTIRALVADASLLEADLAVARAHANATILQILTPDQRAELDEIRARREEQRAERIEERRQRRSRR